MHVEVGEQLFDAEAGRGLGAVDHRHDLDDHDVADQPTARLAFAALRTRVDQTRAFLTDTLAALAGAGFLANILPTGTFGTMLSGGTVPLLNAAVGVEVASGVIVLLAGFLDQLHRTEAAA